MDVIAVRIRIVRPRFARWLMVPGRIEALSCVEPLQVRPFNLEHRRRVSLCAVGETLKGLSDHLAPGNALSEGFFDFLFYAVSLETFQAFLD